MPGSLQEPVHPAGRPLHRRRELVPVHVVISDVRFKSQLLPGLAQQADLIGQFSDLLIGMFGAIEFAATTLGDTPFVNDQTWVRGILSADIQARHEAVFVLLDTIDTTI